MIAAAMQSGEVLDRGRGALLGLACGDAIGTSVEFKPRGTFTPTTDMVGGGPFGLRPGEWTDDTSMALCLADSLLACRGFDAEDQMRRYLRWWRDGYRSATGRCFDIGKTVSDALRRFERTGDPYSGSPDPSTAGNGSLMRLAPVVLFAYPDEDLTFEWAGQSSRTTHATEEAVESCQLLASVLVKALDGSSRETLRSHRPDSFTAPKVQALAAGGYTARAESEIRGSGYCIEALEAALWCFQRTDSFAAAVLAAVNLGDDADTTAAIAGQIAGAHYGYSGIPEEWLARLHGREEMIAIADRLMAHSATKDGG